MKIPLPGGGYLEPQEKGPRTRWHKRILAMTPVRGTRTGNVVELECGHRVTTFGRIDLAGGLLFCSQCRDASQVSN